MCVPNKTLYPEAMSTSLALSLVRGVIENLSKVQLEAIFESLPVDITFIDSDDTVRYYNRDGKRIFIRTPAVIGRKVQNCHPPKSLPAVNQLLSEFKSGRRDVAEFWIQVRGRMIFIRYFPVRDRGGKYLGCLEVSEDITEIKKLEGERRLL